METATIELGSTLVKSGALVLLLGYILKTLWEYHLKKEAEAKAEREALEAKRDKERDVIVDMQNRNIATNAELTAAIQEFREQLSEVRTSLIVPKRHSAQSQSNGLARKTPTT
jgi:hypothetical protein